MKSCPYCGRENTEDRETCSECGSQLQPAPTESEHHIFDRSSDSHTQVPAKLARSRLARFMFAALAVIYILPGIAALFAASEATSRHGSQALATTLVKAGTIHCLVGGLCLIAFLLAVLNRPIADIFGAFALFVVGFLMIKGLTTGVRQGFHMYHLLEPALVVPPLATIGWVLVRRSPASTESML